MNRLLKFLALKRIIAVCLSDTQIAVCRTVKTPFGLIEIDRSLEPIASEISLEETVINTLTPLLAASGWENPAIALAVPASWGFTMISPVSGPTQAQSLTALGLCSEVCRGTDISPDELDVDLVVTERPQENYAGLVGMARRPLHELIDAVKGLSGRLFGVEPIASTMYRHAYLRQKLPGKFESQIRLLLFETHILLIFGIHEIALAWSQFELPQQCTAHTVLTSMMIFRAQLDTMGLEAIPDLLVIHGRHDIELDLDSSDWNLVAGEVLRDESLEIDPGTIVTELAAGCDQEPVAYNLIREQRPGRSVLEIFPWLQVAVEVIALGFGWFMVESSRTDLNQGLWAVQQQLGQFTWAENETVANLKTRKTELLDEAEAIGYFLEHRVPWTTCLSEIQDGLPPNLRIVKITGQAHYNPRGRSRSKVDRNLTLNMEMIIPDGETMPHDNEIFVENLQNSETLTKYFPIIEMGELKSSDQGDGVGATLIFSVICAPES